MFADLLYMTTSYGLKSAIDATDPFLYMVAPDDAPNIFNSPLYDGVSTRTTAFPEDVGEFANT